MNRKVSFGMVLILVLGLGEAGFANPFGDTRVVVPASKNASQLHVGLDQQADSKSEFAFPSRPAFKNMEELSYWLNSRNLTHRKPFDVTKEADEVLLKNSGLAKTMTDFSALAAMSNTYATKNIIAAMAGKKAKNLSDVLYAAGIAVYGGVINRILVDGLRFAKKPGDFILLADYAMGRVANTQILIAAVPTLKNYSQAYELYKVARDKKTVGLAITAGLGTNKWKPESAWKTFWKKGL